MASNLSKVNYVKHGTLVALYILIIWGLYRYLFKLPDNIEELVVKPLLWLIPVIFFVRKEGLGLASLGFTLKNLFPSIYLSLAIGVVFVGEALIINYLKYGQFDFSANVGQMQLSSALFLSFATAVTEEVTFRGYVFNRVWAALNNEWVANIAVSVVWALVHLPITVFIWNLSLSGSLTYLLLTTLFGIGSAFVFARTRNILSPIILHVMWEWPIILFR